MGTRCSLYCLCLVWTYWTISRIRFWIVMWLIDKTEDEFWANFYRLQCLIWYIHLSIYIFVHILRFKVIAHQWEELPGLSEDPSSVPSIHISKQWKICFPCFFFCTSLGWRFLVITWSKILIPLGSSVLGTLFSFCGSSFSLYSLFSVESSTGNSLSSKTDLSCQTFVSEATF